MKLRQGWSDTICEFRRRYPVSAIPRFHGNTACWYFSSGVPWRRVTVSPRIALEDGGHQGDRYSASGTNSQADRWLGRRRPSPRRYTNCMANLHSQRTGRGSVSLTGLSSQFNADRRCRYIQASGQSGGQRSTLVFRLPYAIVPLPATAKRRLKMCRLTL